MYLRINRVAAPTVTSQSAPEFDAATAPQPDLTKDYLARLVKLIPGEVVALYMAGKQIILGSKPPVPGTPPSPGDGTYWIGWTMFCLIALVVVRAYGTREPGKPTQWIAVAIAAISYMVWVYTLGDVFVYWQIWDARLSSLLMVAWTFLVPIFYKGD